MRGSRQTGCIWIMLVAVLFAIPVSAQQERRSVSVVGYATKELSPDQYLVSVRLSANGKSMTLAKAEYAKKIEKLKDVFNEMDFPNLKIESDGMTISNAEVQIGNDIRIMMMEGQIEQAPDSAVYLTENFKFRFEISEGQTRHQIEESLAMFLDKAVEEKLDLGGTTNPNFYPGQDIPQLVCFTHSKAQAESRQLFKAAFENARTQAIELAELAGGKLGPVITVDASSPFEYQAHAYPNGMAENASELTCRLGQKITLQAAVTVRFELQ